MIIKLTLIATLLTIGVSTARGQVNDACLRGNVAVMDGTCWITLDDRSKNQRILGIWTGVATANKVYGLIGHDYFGAPFFSRQWLLADENTTTGDIIRFMNEIYSIPAQRSVRLEDAYFLAVLRSRDEDTNDYDSALRFFRTGRRIPSHGWMHAAIRANTISVTVDRNDTRLEIRLAGLKEASQARAQNAMRFLVGLAKIRQTFSGHCDTDTSRLEPVNLSFEYPFDLFDESGRLSSLVFFTSYSRQMCINGTLVPVPRFMLQGSRINLNRLLLQAGYMALDVDSDVKWSDDNRQVANWALHAFSNLSVDEAISLDNFIQAVIAAK